MIQTINNLLRSPAHQLAICVAFLCISLQYAGLDDVLRWERSLIDQGHWWLLLTGNFVHLGQSHLWMNIAGFVLVVALVWAHFSAKQWLLVIVVSSLFVGVGLWIFNPNVTGYVGFSGTLHGLILAGCLADLRSYPKSAATLLALVIAKLTWEQIAGPLPGSESTAGGSVLVDSHLYGAIGGAIIGAGLLGFMYIRKRSAKL
jgi:rhomboid family GlyGly-CTERM serine protease